MKYQISETSQLRMLFIALVFVLLCLGYSQSAASQMENSEEQFVGDFIEYWASARLLLAGKNPYSPQDLLDLQRTVVSNKKQPLIMWNPPWTLFFVLPFALPSFSTGRFLWLTFNSVCLLVCSSLLWRIYGGDPDRYRSAWLTCFSVVPTYAILYMTQITPLVLLGIVGFLHFQERRLWWLAGVALTLVAIKPHLAYIFGVALILWVLETRQWQVVLGAAAGGMVATIIPVLFKPDVFTHYFQLYSTNAALRPFDWAAPTLSNALRLLFGLENLWVCYIPAISALVWFAFYWGKRRTCWNWIEQMPLLLLVSQATTVFAWTYDQIVLLPALIQVVVWSLRGGRQGIISVALVGFLLINLPTLLLISGSLIPNVFWLFWTAPVFLLAYLAFRTQAAPTKYDPMTQIEIKPVF